MAVTTETFLKIYIDDQISLPCWAKSPHVPTYSWVLGKVLADTMLTGNATLRLELLGFPLAIGGVGQGIALPEPQWESPGDLGWNLQRKETIPFSSGELICVLHWMASLPTLKDAGSAPSQILYQGTNCIYECC